MTDATIRIEFYGVPRRHAGVASVDVVATDLAGALVEAGVALPDFAAACLDGARLRTGFLANVNARRFTLDPATPLVPGDCVLILSADVGG